MALIHDIEILMQTLNANSDVQSIVKTYVKIQECISQKSDQLSENVKDDLISLIKSHMQNESTEVKESALATWVLLLRTFRSITDDFLKIIYDDNTEDFVKRCILPLYSFLIKEGCLESLAILLKQVEPDKQDEMLQSIFQASEEVPTEIYYKFILNNVINSAFTCDDSNIRQKLIKFALFTKEKYPLTSLQRDKQKEIGNLFKGSYIPIIDNLRQKTNSVFYQLAIFVMNYCGKLLHSEIELTNSILRNIEAGFKTRTIDDRLMAYECWKILIDNCNLDHDYLCSNKQLKLLVKPLKIKLSKHEAVVCKRFEVWTHFIEALKEKAIIYIMDYLEYSFGPLSPNKIEDVALATDDVLKTWPKRTDILMKMIGHYGHEQSCIKSVDFKFDKPIVTAANFVTYDYLLINSVGVCCEKLLQWEEDKEARHTSVKCMWGSLFNIIRNLNDKYKEDVLKKLCNQIKHLLKKSLTQEEYFEDILKYVFECLTAFKKPICDVSVINQVIIWPVLEMLLPESEMKSESITSIIELVKYGSKVNDKLIYFDKVCALFKTSQHKKKECILSLELWLQLAEVLLTICKTPRDSFQEFEANAKFFMSWIVKYIFSCSFKESILDIWKNILMEINAISPLFKESLSREIETILKESPDLAVNVIDFLQILIQLLSDEKGNKDYAVVLLGVTSECLQNPCIPKAKVVSLVSVVKKIIEIISLHDTNDEVFLGKLCSCVTNILQPHQVFEILPVLKVYFAKIKEDVKQKLHNSLYKVISDLVKNSNAFVAKDAAFLLSQLDKPNKQQKKSAFVQPILSSRSARIATMATGSNSPPVSSGDMLRLFGQNIESSASPLRVKGSQLSKPTPSPRAQKIANALPKFTKNNKNVENDDKDFVLIDTKVTVEKNKMSEHQREVMKKRRDDIPALYQDLTQSQTSNSIEFSENSASNDLVVQNKPNINEIIDDDNCIVIEDDDEDENKPSKEEKVDNVSDKTVKSNTSGSDLDATYVASLDLKDVENATKTGKDFTSSKDVVLDFEVLDFDSNNASSQETGKQEESNQGKENDIINSFAENNICIDEKFLAADLFVGFNQTTSLESENNDELNNLMSSKQQQMSDDDGFEEANVSKKSTTKTHLDFEQSVKCPDLSIFDFVSSEIDDIEQSSDIDNLLHDLRKTPAKRNRRSLSYDSSQTDDAELNATEMGKKQKRRSALLRKRKIQNMHTRIKKTFKETLRKKSLVESEKNANEIASTLINECQILKQLDDEILKIDKNLKENSDVAGNSFSDGILVNESFEDIEKPLETEEVEKTVEKIIIIEDIVEESFLEKSDENKESESVEITEVTGTTDGMKQNDTNTEDPPIVIIEEPNEKEDANKEKIDDHSEDIFHQTSDSDTTAIDSSLLESSNKKENDDIVEIIDLDENEKSEETLKDSVVDSVEVKIKTDDDGKQDEKIQPAEDPEKPTESVILAAEENPIKETEPLLSICAVQSMEEDANATKSPPHIHQITETSEISVTDENNERTAANSSSTKRRRRKQDFRNLKTPPFVRQRRTRLLDKLERSITNEDIENVSANTTQEDPLKLDKTEENATEVQLGLKEVKRDRRRRIKVEKPIEVKQEDPLKEVKLEEIQDVKTVFIKQATKEDPFDFDKQEESDQTYDVYKFSRRDRRRRPNYRSKQEESFDADIAENNPTDEASTVKKARKARKIQVVQRGNESEKEEEEETEVEGKAADSYEEIQQTISKFLNSMKVSNIFSEKKVEENEAHKSRKRRIRKIQKDDEETATSSSENIFSRGRIRRRKDFLSATPEASEDDEALLNRINKTKKHARQRQSPGGNSGKRRRLSLLKQENFGGSPLFENEGQESQDVIESSQASSGNCESILKKSETKGEVFKKENEQLNSEIKKAVNSITKNRSPLFTLSVDENRSKELKSSLESLEEHNTHSDDAETPKSRIKSPVNRRVRTRHARRSLDSNRDEETLSLNLEMSANTADTETCNPDETFTVENDAPGLIDNINIDSLPIGFVTTPEKDNLPGSPVCDDTPVRNSELFTNTSDISPIRTHKDTDELVSAKKEEIIQQQPISRSAKLLNLVPGSSPSLRLSKSIVQNVKRIAPIRVSSPSTERIRKMMMSCGEKVKSPTFDNESDSEIAEYEILAFTKEIPSPLAIPSNSILKRKAFEISEEGSSPHPKRKRVNFSDPPITSQKIFYKEEDENKLNFKKTFKKLPFKISNDAEKDDGINEASFSLITGLNLMKAEPIYPQLTSCNNDIKEITTILGKEGLLEQFHSVNVMTVGDLAKLNDAQVAQLEFLDNPRLIKVVDALEVFYSSHIDDDDEAKQSNALQEEDADSIFPELIECKDSVQNILKLFATRTTAREFQRKNIITIGDLAKLSKNEIYELSIQIPKISHVMHALNIYYRKLRKEQKLKQEIEEFFNYTEGEPEVMKCDVEAQTCSVDVVTSDQASQCNPTTESDMLKNLSQNDLLEFIRSHYSSDEIKILCEALQRENA